MTQTLGLLLSFGYVFFIMGVASFLLSKKILSGNGARKLIHIAVGHWWFIAMVTMPDLGYAIIGPGVFILLNWLVYRFHLVPAMESRGSNLGTVYYPISLFVLVVVTWTTAVPQWIGGLGIMILAWGDGFASLVGATRGQNGPQLPLFGKSLIGTLTMAGVSFVVTLVMVSIFSGPLKLVLIFKAVVVAIGAAGVEALTPWGLDNISVPLVSAGLMWLLLL